MKMEVFNIILSDLATLNCEAARSLLRLNRSIMEDLNDRIMKLEMLYTEQEDVIQVLSRLVHHQQTKIEILEKQLIHVAEKILKSDGENESEVAEPPPPHY